MTDDIDLHSDQRSEGNAEAVKASGSRRGLITKGGVAIAAAAAGVVALSDTAGAADTDYIQIGRPNSGSANSSRTLLSNSVLDIDASSASTFTYAIRGNSGRDDAGAVGVLGEVTGSSAAGTGVKGRSDAGIGVLGEAVGNTSSGTGVQGRGTAIGVLGEAGTSTIQGAGVVGRSQTGPSLKLDESALSLPLSGSWSAGSFVVVDGHVFYCWKAGTGNAASWVKLSGAPIILPTGYRAYDSRAGKAPTTVQKGKTQSGKIRSNIDLTVGSGGALPLGISAVIINLTATGTDVSGYLTAYKNGSATPKTSSVNWSSTNSNIANTTIVPVDSASRIAITGAGSADFLIDVIGFLP